jgi:hypothetical protein
MQIVDVTNVTTTGQNTSIAKVNNNSNNCRENLRSLASREHKRVLTPEDGPSTSANYRCVNLSATARQNHGYKQLILLCGQIMSTMSYTIILKVPLNTGNGQ